jgi:hypothetical protein
LNRKQDLSLAEENLDMKMRRFMLLLLVIADLAAWPVLAKAQSSATPPDSPGTVANTPPAQRDLTYTRPTEKTKFHNYIFDMIGPFPILGAALSAGINQADNTPPEWRQGAEAYGKRFGSNFGIAAVSTTTRYTLAEVFGEDTLYYRCECKGFFPRLSHAMISTLVTRRGDDGHHVFSVPSLVAPYAGTMTAVYAWYPSRYNAKDGFRMGNYTLLGYAGGNIAREFIYGGPHSLLSRHMHHGQGAQNQDSKP